jgi:hypothetical protein
MKPIFGCARNFRKSYGIFCLLCTVVSTRGIVRTEVSRDAGIRYRNVRYLSGDMRSHKFIHNVLLDLNFALPPIPAF